MKTLSCIRLAATLATVWCASAISAKAADAPSAPLVLKNPIAIVNGEKISSADLQKAFDTAIGRAPDKGASLTPDQKLQGYNMLLEQMVMERILNKKAAGTKVDDKLIDEQIAKIKESMGTPEAFAEQLKKMGKTEAEIRDQMRNEMINEQWIRSQIDAKVKVTDADVEQFYKSNGENFKAPEQVRASHILIRAEPNATAADLLAKKIAIQTAAERVKKGEDFAKVAKEVSEDPGSKESGGDLNFFPKDQMVPEFADAAFKMKVGDVSDPVRSQFGFHVIKVTDHKDARTVPLDEAKPKIQAFLERQKKQAAAGELFDQLRKEAKVESFLPPAPKEPTSLVPPPQGAAPTK